MQKSDEEKFLNDFHILTATPKRSGIITEKKKINLLLYGVFKIRLLTLKLPWRCNSKEGV